MEYAAGEKKNNESSDNLSSIPLSEYAKKLETRVKRRYLEKISSIGIDPVLVDSKLFEPDCLPPVESTDLLFYLVLETSFYTNQQFKAFRSLEAYNQMVSGFIASVEGHIISDKFVVVAKVRHSQRMNDALIPVWIITERHGNIISCHCLGCKAGLAESCSHVASVLFYLEAWTKINGKLSCTQVKCTWILPTYVKQVDYARVRDINFTSARKMKTDLEKKIDCHSDISTQSKSAQNLGPLKSKNSKECKVPTKPEMDAFYAEINKSQNKAVVLSLISPYSSSFVLKSRSVPTVNDLFEKKYLDLSYPELMKVCQGIKIEISKDHIEQIERDTLKQSKGHNFFKHRAGRIGASQSKAACHSDPALPSQSLIQAICYPELTKFTTKATVHGCKHEEDAIKTYEQIMKENHTNFKVQKCGLFINEAYPYIHATPDFLCSCDCCGEGCGEVKCPFCIEDCDFNSYLSKSSSCLLKDSNGMFTLKQDHQYYYQVQQQLFTLHKDYCDFVVCAFGDDGSKKLVQPRIFPDKEHWEIALPKLTTFWRTCVLPEVLGKWSTRRHTSKKNEPTVCGAICFCRTAQDTSCVTCANSMCPISTFHLSCLGLTTTPKTWYCPNCRMLPEFKHSKGKSKPAEKEIAPSKALALDNICICKSKAKNTDKLIECHNPVCKNGTFFHLACLDLKRMPNNAKSTWLCPDCKKNQAQSKQKKGSGGVQFVKQTKGTNNSLSDKQKSLGRLTQSEFDLVASPAGWLDCTVIQEAHVLLMKINSNISGFQRPTLGPVRQFSVVTGDFIQIVHVNNNHWVCLTSIGCHPGCVYLLDSMTSPISQEVIELTKNLLGPNFKNISHLPVQQQHNGSDCGVFAIAYATCLAYGKTPVVKFIIPRMRHHLLNCLKAGHLTLFPTT